MSGSNDVNPANTRTISGENPPELALGRPHSVPETIGPYRVFAPLGEGGMGTVYEAEQEHPRRRVALKVIRGGQFVDAQSVRLFQREVQTLARLLHPNIAAIYEAGHTDTGEHFFAMELVRGSTLDRYIAERNKALDNDEIRYRLELFLTLCEAVSYAHQRGVIHLDLKPSNVIVPSPKELKVLDFGLARITASVAEMSVMSEVGVIRGTLPYMSPEQVRGESDRVDVRSDVYSLGVILQEMLTGKRPYDVGGMSVVEAIRVISEQAPTPLKQAWTGPKPPDLDLQTIIGKALEKEPADRYASAAALAEDVERYLDERPILARAPSTIYQLKKLVRRHRTAVAGIAATLVALVAGIVAATTFGLREAHQRELAEQARLDSQAVVDFQSGMLREIDPRHMGRLLAADLEERVGDSAAFRAQMERVNTTDAALTLIDQSILAQAMATAAARFKDRPRIHAQLLSSIGDTYQQLGLFERAEPPLKQAIALSSGAPRLVTTRILAGVYETQGRMREAESLYVATLAEQTKLLGPDDPEVLQTMDGLALLHVDNERYASAESLYAIIVPTARRVLGAEAPQALSVLGNAAWALTSDGKYAQAESLSVLVLQLRRKVLGNDHRETMNAANNLGVLYVQTDRPELAVPLYEEDLAASRKALGDEHPDVLVSMTNLGRLYNRMKRFDRAEPLLRDAVAKTQRVMPPGFIGLGISRLAHSEALVGLGRLREAEPEALEAYRIFHALGGNGERGVRRAVEVLVDVFDGTGRTAQALKWKARLPNG
jgi:non-specific serine/threonine protein kinase/serine/threonine-protein kinase